MSPSASTDARVLARGLPAHWTCVALTCAIAMAQPQVARNAPAGKLLYDGRGGCTTCHSIGDRGANLGPDLGAIGITRTSRSLRLALVEPDAEVEKQYYTVVVEPGGGRAARGLLLNEDDLSIQLRDVDGNLRSFLKDNLKRVRKEPRSIMPSYGSRLSRAEIDDVVAYLRTLKGPPLPADAKRPRKPNRTCSDPACLERIGRDAEERPDSLIQELEIPPGAVAAEVGAGTGYFTWRLAAAAGPRGKVYAVDVRQSMLDLTAETVKKHNLANVEFMLGSEDDPHLPAASLDVVLIANSYHEFSQPEAMIRAVSRALKPDGRLVVVEYTDEHPDPGEAEGMGAEQIRAEIEPLGFELDRLLDLMPTQHGLIFTKRP